MHGDSSRGRRVYHLVRTMYAVLAVFALAVLGVAVWGFNIALKERDVWFALGAMLPVVAIGIEMLVKSLRTRNSGALAMRERFERLDAHINAYHTGSLEKEQHGSQG